MQCPYCKETIQEGAIKCRHCGSMLNSAPTQPQQSGYGFATQQQAASNIDQLNVSVVWKTRFKAFQEYGSQPERPWWMLGGYLFRSNNKQLAWRGMSVMGKDNYMSYAAMIFGPLWYIVKGMWKKGLSLLAIGFVVNLIVIDVLGIQDYIFGSAVIGGIALGSASYDFYKYKMFNQASWW